MSNWGNIKGQISGGNKKCIVLNVELKVLKEMFFVENVAFL